MKICKYGFPKSTLNATYGNRIHLKPHSLSSSYMYFIIENIIIENVSLENFMLKYVIFLLIIIQTNIHNLIG